LVFTIFNNYTTKGVFVQNTTEMINLLNDFNFERPKINKIK
jgi:hypothetical protein